MPWFHWCGAVGVHGQRAGGVAACRPRAPGSRCPASTWRNSTPPSELARRLCTTWPSASRSVTRAPAGRPTAYTCRALPRAVKPPRRPPRPVARPRWPVRRARASTPTPGRRRHGAAERARSRASSSDRDPARRAGQLGYGWSTRPLCPRSRISSGRQCAILNPMTELKIPRDRDDDYAPEPIKARQELIREQTGVARPRLVVLAGPGDPARQHRELLRGRRRCRSGWPGRCWSTVSTRRASSSSRWRRPRAPWSRRTTAA